MGRANAPLNEGTGVKNLNIDVIIKEDDQPINPLQERRVSKRKEGSKEDATPLLSSVLGHRKKVDAPSDPVSEFGVKVYPKNAKNFSKDPKTGMAAKIDPPKLCDLPED
jgi:hypothetical protein